MSIHFFNEDIVFQIERPNEINEWLANISVSFQKDLNTLNYIFCSDDYLLSINKEYLDHDFYTDIITFDNSDEEDEIIGDIFISVERVKENAQELEQPFETELYRVMAHGLLHLIGYKDGTSDEKLLMRQKENSCLSLLNNK